MKKTLLLLLIILPFYLSIAQTVNGTVVNNLDQPIPQVSIYLDGTTTGTTSAVDGSFSLNISNIKNGTVVFQKDSYDTFTINISEIPNKTIKVELLKAKTIEEVKIIPYTEAAYRNYIQYFLDTFIGYDQENVKIKNQRTLKFSYDKENRILKVKSPQTLRIENKKLGYTVDYNLVDFTADFENQTMRYIGTSFFTETKNTDKIRLNRMNAFEGIQEHFFRSVFMGTTKNDGFVVNQITKFPNEKYPTAEELQRLKDFAKDLKNKTIISLPPDLLDISSRKRNEVPYKIAVTKSQIPESDYIKYTDGKVILDYDHMMQINYKKYFYELKKGKSVKSNIPVIQTSYLHPEGHTFEIYVNGNNSNPEEMMNQGEFASTKIEKLLPLDYQLGD
ncbi:hypothetical protein ASG31_13600 [Chryseobacterium sp. Leaf404]|uniref:carboxypeptidase-like regulatory domain-containing protein n=1 Tax=unclassified Chryseobacterium TaxID=2593645 RepID=UPI0006F69764|nr:MULTISPECIES: carboxypeptidase-like regulatory domain-containing protein [unclassified Chryseobacterium]KQT16008.1 hypothetical protein ASG31_13600 [Chryseobacterium sp. Leaf404]